MSRYRIMQSVSRPRPAQKLQIQISPQGECFLNSTRCAFEMSQASLRNYNQDFVYLMQRVRREVIRTKSINISADFFKDVMNDLRDVGLSAYASLGEQVYTYLDNHQNKDRGLGTDITVSTEAYPLLWEFLYSGSPIEPVDAQLFWGYRHRITRNLIGAKQFTIGLDPEKDFLFCRNHRLMHSQKEMDDLRALAIGPFITLDELFDAQAPEYNNLSLPKRFFRVCGEHDFSFLHFASHLWADQRSGNVLRASLELSYRLNRIPIMLLHLKARRRELQFIQAPLVFLNASQTMTNPQHLMQGESFPRSFLELGAGAVIATTCDMPDIFAVEFARKFYEIFFDASQAPTASQALTEARRYFIDQYNNPLGLAYALYGDNELTIDWGNKRPVHKVEQRKQALIDHLLVEIEQQKKKVQAQYEQEVLLRQGMDGFQAQYESYLSELERQRRHLRRQIAGCHEQMRRLEEGSPPLEDTALPDHSPKRTFVSEEAAEEIAAPRVVGDEPQKERLRDHFARFWHPDMQWEGAYPDMDLMATLNVAFEQSEDAVEMLIVLPWHEAWQKPGQHEGVEAQWERLIKWQSYLEEAEKRLAKQLEELIRDWRYPLYIAWEKAERKQDYFSELAHDERTEIQRLKQSLTFIQQYLLSLVVVDIQLNLPSEPVFVGEEFEVGVSLRPGGRGEGVFYSLSIPNEKLMGGEVNLFLEPQGVQVRGSKEDSLPLMASTSALDELDRQIEPQALFRVSASRPGVVEIRVDLYFEESFRESLVGEVEVEAADLGLIKRRVTPRPVPQPDLVLQVASEWKKDGSAVRFRYRLDGFRGTSFQMDGLSSPWLAVGWLEQVRGLLGVTIEGIGLGLVADARARLKSFGRSLYREVLDHDLQKVFKGAGWGHALLIVADQEAWLPWELLHDGRSFLGERFLIGRWPRESDDSRPYEFPIGAVSVAHYASIERIEEPHMWAQLLKPPFEALEPEILTGGVLDLKHVDRLRGLHLIRRAQLEQRNLPVPIKEQEETIAKEVQRSKLSLRRNRPLVTLSYLSAGQAELTQLTQSWAPTYINAGCSAFIGPLWAVDEAVEAAFVGTFYAELWKGGSLGEAFRRAQHMARVAVPERLDWLAYILFGDPMARPYRPVKGNGYAVVEPVGRQKEDPVSAGASARFRVKLRRTPPVWHENRVIEVADELQFDDLQVHIIAPDLTIKPGSPIEMVRTPEGDYLGWCTLVVPDEITDDAAHVQLYFVHEEQMVHSLMFSLPLKVREVNDERS